jgi:hypothetical protein
MNYVSGICDDLLETILLCPSKLSVRDLIRFGSVSKEMNYKISKNLNKYIHELVSKKENNRCGLLSIEEENDSCTLYVIKEKLLCTCYFMHKTKRHDPKDVFFDFHIRKIVSKSKYYRKLLSELLIDNEPLYITYHMEKLKKRHNLKDVLFELEKNEFMIFHSPIKLYYYSPGAIIITINENLLYTIYTFAQVYDQQVGYVELTEEDMRYRLVLDKKISFDTITKMDIDNLLSDNHTKSKILRYIHKKISSLH